eukprot:327748-Pelagomonas_calceolata.AAC.1
MAVLDVQCMKLPGWSCAASSSLRLITSLRSTQCGGREGSRWYILVSRARFRFTRVTRGVGLQPENLADRLL